MQQHCVPYKKLCMRAFCLKFATAKEAWDILSMNFGVRGSSCFNSSYILWLCYAIFRSIEGKRNQPIAEKKNEDDIAEFDKVLVQDECNKNRLNASFEKVQVSLAVLVVHCWCYIRLFMTILNQGLLLFWSTPHSPSLRPLPSTQSKFYQQYRVWFLVTTAFRGSEQQQRRISEVFQSRSFWGSCKVLLIFRSECFEKISL